jgi:hypothetical protein
MSLDAVHATLTLGVGVAFGLTWVRLFWSGLVLAPGPVLWAPLVVGFMGLGHGFASGFRTGIWAGDVSVFQGLFNLAVTLALVYRRAAIRRAAAS